LGHSLGQSPTRKRPKRSIRRAPRSPLGHRIGPTGPSRRRCRTRLPGCRRTVATRRRDRRCSPQVAVRSLSCATGLRRGAAPTSGNSSGRGDRNGRGHGDASWSGRRRLGRELEASRAREA